MATLTPASDPRRFQFLLLPGFSMLGFIAALEPLRAANRFGGALYEWRILSADGQAPRASDGISLVADQPMGAAPPADCVFVVAGYGPLAHHTPRIAAWLQRLDRAGATLGAIDTGSFVLAASALLGHGPVTLHWEAIPAFREAYPQIAVTQELFEISGRRITCAGGTASLDLMLHLIGRDHGSELAMQVSEQFVQGRIRSRPDHQRMQIASRYGVHNKRLVQALDIMERQLSEPLSSAALAAQAGITRRQLERLFRTHLDASPARFHLGLRLERARQLLAQTDLSVMETAIACGFESASHFARRYRARFGRSPSRDRGLRPSAGERG